MPSRLLRRAALLTLVLTACDSTTEPERPVDLALDFCSNDIPAWFAYRNSGGGWTRVTPDAEGTFRFTASNEVGIAFVFQNGGDVETEVIYAANTELEQVSGLACLEEGGTKIVNGSVAGLPTGTYGRVSMNFSMTAGLTPSQPQFQLPQLASRPLDVVATRYSISASSAIADRVIIRRSQSYVSGATMPVLDFASAESKPTTSFLVTTSGVLSGEFGILANTFYSQLETAHDMASMTDVGNGSLMLAGVPATELAAGDYHDLYAVAVSGDGSTRGMERWFRAPANQQIALGPPLSEPTVGTAALTPYVRVRAQAPRQLDYDRAFVAAFSQQSGVTSVEQLTLTVTSGYASSGSWDVSMPDFSGAAGWQNSWAFGSGSVEWSVFAYGGRVELLFGARPGDGEFVRFASVASAPQSVQGYGTPMPGRAHPRRLRRR